MNIQEYTNIAENIKGIWGILLAMGTIVLLLLCGWLAFTALLSIRAGFFARSSALSDGTPPLQQLTRISGAQELLPSANIETRTNTPTAQDAEHLPNALH